MALPAKDFPSLVRWVADQHHGGVVDHIADKVGISSALADKWVKGRVRVPGVPTLKKFCAAYGFDFGEVLALVYRLPRRRLAKTLGALALAWLSMGSVPGQAGTLYEPQVPDNMRLIGTRYRRQWRAPCYA